MGRSSAGTPRRCRTVDRVTKDGDGARKTGDEGGRGLVALRAARGDVARGDEVGSGCDEGGSREGGSRERGSEDHAGTVAAAAARPGRRNRSLGATCGGLTEQVALGRHHELARVAVAARRYPRTTATGTPSSLPMTSSAAPAISSATAITRRVQLVADAVARAAAGRAAAGAPAAPIATSVVPCRQARPNESLTITPTSRPVSSRSRVAQARGGRVRVDREQDDRVRPRARSRRRRRPRRRRSRAASPRSRAAAGRRTMRAVSRRITSIRRGSRRPRARAHGRDGSTSSSAHDAPLGLRDRLLRDDDDVAVLELAPRSAISARRGRRPPRSPAGPRPARTVSITEAGDADAGVRLVAPVDVDDHRRHALERAGVRERAGVERAARRRGGRRARARAPSRRRRRRRRARPRRAARAGEVRRPRAVQPGGDRRGDERRRPRSASERASASGHARRLGRSAARSRRESTGVSPIASASSRAVSSAASDFVASTTRSTPRTASSFAPPSDAELAPRSARPLGVARADHDLVARARSRSASARPKLPVPPTIATLIAAPPPLERGLGHAGAARSASPISVRVTIGRTPASSSLVRVRLVDHERVDQALRSSRRRAPASCRPPAAPASGRPAPSPRGRRSAG